MHRRLCNGLEVEQMNQNCAPDCCMIASDSEFISVELMHLTRRLKHDWSKRIRRLKSKVETQKSCLHRLGVEIRKSAENAKRSRNWVNIESRSVCWLLGNKSFDWTTAFQFLCWMFCANLIKLIRAVYSFNENVINISTRFICYVNLHFCNNEVEFCVNSPQQVELKNKSSRESLLLS